MSWVIAVVVIAIIADSLDSMLGKIVAGSAVAAIGLLLLSWITGIGFLITLAKLCGTIIVIAIIGTILLAIIGS